MTMDVEIDAVLPRESQSRSQASLAANAALARANAPPKADPKVELDKLLKDNFDATSKAAIIVVSKYLNNIAMNPQMEKFRSINMSNKVFIEKVAPAKNMFEVLKSFGFVARAGNENGTMYVLCSILLL
jgi:hypothetical protein